MNLVPPPLNAAWNNLQNPFSEDVLEYEEAQYEEELRQLYTQDITIQIPGGDAKEEEEEEEEADFIGEEMEEMEEYGDEIQMQEIQ